MDEKKGMSKKHIIVIIAVLVAAAFAHGRIRLYLIGNDAKQFTKDAGISLEYNPVVSVTTKEAFLQEIIKLAEWECETRKTINKAYRHSDNEFLDKQKYSAWSKEETKNGYEDREEIYSFMMEKEWYGQRLELQKTVKEIITALFGGKTSRYGLMEEAVQEAYSEGYFDRILLVISYAQEGKGEEAFSIARYGLIQSTAVLSLDIAYGLYPELMTEACRNCLQEAMDENEWIDVSNAVRYCENFQKRYDVEIEGLKKAKEMEKRLDYENKPDIPKVGMTLSQAYDTKLGVPTRSDRKKSTYAGADHYWGHLYWDQGGRQIFSAYYGDNVIKDVWDTRTCQGKPRRKYSGSSGSSSSSSFDPDDHDIEAYYDDNRDEYDSYEDAYEGFLDDESSWDDY